MNKFISVIPLREGSKGIKNKNLQLINGEPLYIRAIKQAERVTEKCIVNTDIVEILNKNFTPNIKLYKRAKEYAKDSTEMTEVLNDLFSNIELRNEIIVLLQATSPLRNDSDIKKAIEIYKSGHYSLVLSVKKAKSNVLKFGFSDHNQFIPINTNYLFKNRQSLPEVFSPNGAIYIFSVKDFQKKNCFPVQNIGFYEMSYETSIDIDNYDDLKKVNRIIANK